MNQKPKLPNESYDEYSRRIAQEWLTEHPDAPYVQPVNIEEKEAMHAYAEGLKNKPDYCGFVLEQVTCKLPRHHVGTCRA